MMLRSKKTLDIRFAKVVMQLISIVFKREPNNHRLLENIFASLLTAINASNES